MRGEATLWSPSIDHAGLSTQVAVRLALSKQGVRFEDLPREEALARIETWRREHETVIREQLERGGFSLDWTRSGTRWTRARSARLLGKCSSVSTTRI